MKPNFVIRRLGLLLSLAVFNLTVAAAPAPWYLWQSRVDGATFCAQTAPGDGWQRVAGPFRDAGCRTPG